MSPGSLFLSCETVLSLSSDLCSPKSIDTVSAERSDSSLLLRTDAPFLNTISHSLIGLVLRYPLTTYVYSQLLIANKSAPHIRESRALFRGSRDCWRICSKTIGSRDFPCWVEWSRHLQPLVCLSMWLWVFPLVSVTGLGL